MTTVFRPLVDAGEFALFDALPDPGLVGRAAFGDTLADMAAAGEYRPSWCWIGLRDGMPVARAAWWGGPDDREPLDLDWFDFTDADAGVALLQRAPWRTEYGLRLPPSWANDPHACTEATRRVEVAHAAGYRTLVERYRYRWRRDRDPMPLRPTRLTFAPDSDDATFLALLRRVHVGSLDAHARAIGARVDLDTAAREELEFLRWLPSPREWWLVARDASGDVVGFVVPARNHTESIVAYIGVVPEQRGHGYARDLVAEATHRLCSHGHSEVVASTDTTNTPMASAFELAGYPVEQHKIDLVPTDELGLDDHDDTRLAVSA